MVEKVTIDTSKENQGPTIEESLANLQAEGLVPKDGEENAQGDPNLPSDDQGGETKQGSNDDRPTWLPEKFATPEDMAKAYGELETKQSTGDEPVAPEGEAKETLENAGLNIETYSAEFAEKGELSSASYDALAQAGIPKEMVDSYIAGQTARSEAYDTAGRTLAGGSDAYDAMVEWAGDTLTDAEIEQFDTAVNSMDKTKAEFAIKGLKARYDAKNGSPPERQLDGKGNNAGGSAYESTAQLLADMNDSRYETDPAFRAKVESKLSRSSIM